MHCHDFPLSYYLWDDPHPMIPAPSPPPLLQVNDYEKVTASGTFLHDKSVFVGPRPRKYENSVVVQGGDEGHAGCFENGWMSL